jgi:hypothetical protein
MSAQVIPFNPLDKKNLGVSIALAILTREAHPLANLAKFDGAGIYAIYYMGPFRAYRRIADLNSKGIFRAPIYIGKAVPSGARKGGKTSEAIGHPLYKRLTEHAESLRAARNLDVDDFVCRFLVVDDIWIPLGESLLIARFSPVWNSLVDGFGNHDPGGRRYEGMRPRWDVLHPGRTWADKCQDRPESAEDIALEVGNYLDAFDFPDANWFDPSEK